MCRYTFRDKKKTLFEQLETRWYLADTLILTAHARCAFLVTPKRSESNEISIVFIITNSF